MRNNLWLALCVLFLLPVQALAHSASTAYLYWRGAGEPVRLDVAVADVQRLVRLDTQSRGEVYWRDVIAQQSLLAMRIARDLRFRGDETVCETAVSVGGLAYYGERSYVSLILRPGCDAPTSIMYRLFDGIDTQHRLVAEMGQGDHRQIVVVTPGGGEQLALSAERPMSEVFKGFVVQGMLHLWQGLDHILFVVTLLLALCVEQYRRPRARRHVVLRALAVVSAFTIAHSVTLALATLGGVSLPARWVEVCIAASITLAAVNVIWPFLTGRLFWLAFGFGLVHGFGFSSVLAELLGASTAKVVALAGFNLGVEIGQALLVVAVLPVLLAVAHRQRFHQWALPAMVAAISITGLTWTVERALG